MFKFKKKDIEKFIEAYNIVERRAKLNGKTPFHRKRNVADNIGLINY